jgi:methylaspartate ammonia-lyase
VTSGTRTSTRWFSRKRRSFRHGLINNVATKRGARGEIFARYVGWVRDRILELRTRDDYTPMLYFDVYGTIGEAFDLDVEAVAD